MTPNNFLPLPSKIMWGLTVLVWLIVAVGVAAGWVSLVCGWGFVGSFCLGWCAPDALRSIKRHKQNQERDTPICLVGAPLLDWIKARPGVVVKCSVLFMPSLASIRYDSDTGNFYILWENDVDPEWELMVDPYEETKLFVCGGIGVCS